MKSDMNVKSICDTFLSFGNYHMVLSFGTGKIYTESSCSFVF